MKRIETKVLFRCHGLGQLMSNPIGRSNEEKYVDAVEKLEKAEIALAALEEKLTKSKAQLVTLEAGKDNEVPERKNGKSPAQKYVDTQKDIEAIDEKILMAIQKKCVANVNKVNAELVKDEVLLSATAKKFLKTMAIEIRYNRRKRMTNKYVKKGLAVEDESIRLYSELKGEFLENNKKRKSNEFFTGEWDIEIENSKKEIEEVDDIKSRYDIDTFEDNRDEDAQAKERDQLLGYMSILGCKKAKVINVLTNNSFELIVDEIKRETFSSATSKLDGFDLPLVKVLEIAKDHIFDLDSYNEFIMSEVGFNQLMELQKKTYFDEDAVEMYHGFVEVPLEERIIEVEVERDEERIDLMKVRAMECRKWLEDKYNIHHAE